MPDDKDQLNLGPSLLPNDGQTPELVFNPPPVSPSVPQAPVSPPGSSVNPSSPVSEPASAPTSPPVTPTPSSPGHSGQAQVRAYHSSNPYLNNPKPASEEITRSKPDLDAIFPGQPSSPPLKISSEKQTSPTSRFQAPTSVTPGRPKDYDPKLDNIPKRSTSNQPPLSNENNLTHNINEALNPVKISKPSFSASPPAKQEENKPSSKLEVQSVHTLRADAEVFLKEKNLSDYQAIFIDFHAEATSEKVAMGWYADGRVSVVAGTHTHVPTADSKILPKGTAYISDVGMTGPAHSVIGVEVENVMNRFLEKGEGTRFEYPEEGECEFNAILVEVNDRKATSIELIQRKVNT